MGRIQDAGIAVIGHLFQTTWFSPAGSWATALAYAACALAVTLDALQKKGDVRSALGWIAIAWLSPFLGALLYYLFGINRVARRALKFEKRDMDRPPPIPAAVKPGTSPGISLLAAISARVTEYPLTDSNGVEILDGGAIAYPAMLEAIRGARKSVGLSSYIFQGDATGAQFVEALIAAHRRGVAVRVLIDGIGGGYFRSTILNDLAAAGVPAARFLHSWVPWRMPFLNMRNHRKILVADGATAFVGGLNIGHQYAAGVGQPDAVQDIHFRLRGPVVRQITDVFARDWTFATDEVLDDPCWWPAVTESGSVLAHGLRSGPDEDIYKLEIVLGAALTQAQHRVRIVTPYFLPDQRLQFAIGQAVLRGVKVEILIPGRSDNRVMDWAMRAHLRFFRHIPATFYFTAQPFDHSKLATIDGEWSLIGSSNWDIRSLRLNFEFDLECYDAELADALDKLIDRKIAAAQLAGPRQLTAPLWQRLRDAAFRLLLPYL
jgi:cardiolipin synthase